MLDFTTKMMFKAFVVHMLNAQEFIIDTDDMIECLMEICQDLKEEKEQYLK